MAVVEFFYPSLKWSKSCAQTMPFEFSEKFKFWPNSKTYVAAPCGIVQMSFQMFERAFLSQKNADIRIRIDQQMATISLFEWLNFWCANPLFKFKIQRVKNKNKKLPTFFFSRRRAAAVLHQTLHEDRGFPYHFCTLLIFQSDQYNTIQYYFIIF